jgi:hypothetical protein
MNNLKYAMRKTAFTLLVLILSLQAFGQKDTDTVISNNPKNLKLKVYYFHITNRCNTCRSIEANVRKTIDEYFLHELVTGAIDLYILNCDLPENKELATKYDAYGATLAFSQYINGAEQKPVDLTDWAFKEVQFPELFVSRLKDKISELIK